jgi:hypothetical protein
MRPLSSHEADGDLPRHFTPIATLSSSPGGSE